MANTIKNPIEIFDLDNHDELFNLKDNAFFRLKLHKLCPYVMMSSLKF